PTTLLLLLNPFACCVVFELSRIRALSQVPAASTTVFVFTSYSCMSSLLTYDTPVAKPLLSVLISLTTAFVITVRFPVFIAGITKQDEAEKSPYTLHERLHWPQ